MKAKLSNFINGVLQNVLANIIVVVAIPLIGGIYAFYVSNTQTALLVALILLAAINSVTNLLLLKRQREITEALQDLSAVKQWLPSAERTRDPITEQADDEFEITDKRFDDFATPQKLVIQFANRGSNIIHVKKVKYSDNSLGIPAAALAPSYRKEGRGFFIIPFDQSKAEVAPGQTFDVEIRLGQTWKREDVNRVAGQWGYLKLDVIYKDQAVELFTSI
jgi:hypothetical protein